MSNQARIDYRIRLGATIDCARFLLQQGLPFRGHDETEDSKNQDKGCVIERFVGIVHITDTSSLSLKEVIDGFFSLHGLSMTSLHGQALVAIAKNHVEIAGLFLLVVNVVNVIGVSAKRQDMLREKHSANTFEALNNVIDMQLQELNNHFTEKSTELLLCVACLNPSNSFTTFDKQKLICIAQFYPRDFSTMELLIFEDQLQNYIIDVCSDNMFVGLTSIGDFSQKMVITAKDKVYPLVYRLLTLALILPVTTATVKRIFSAMSIIKTQFRTRMKDQWMNDCLVAYIERDLFDKIDNEAIMYRFQNMKSRRGQL
ncbi:uncharacterized protein LOC103491145 [Cucumis melo]|uniref:Uncharacterized protein LOC103491145 n=1 Tax=Cucumis melo TaxID=3656 RepID=A0A1S3BM43_CUCME|nr:uncharacterized protein LOC103491145 [Cucumis melo]